MSRFFLSLVVAFSITVISLAQAVKGGREHDGEVIQCDLPDQQHTKNTGGSDGAGLCVFCSIEHSAKFQNVDCLLGLQQWMEKKPGGGYPEKVAKILPEFCKDKGCPTPLFIQHTGGDMDFLRLALNTNRYVSVTYSGRDNVYYKQTVSHMVNLVHLSNKWAVIHDNNYPHSYLWMPVDFFEKRWKDQSGGWAVVLLTPPPAPIPTLADNSQPVRPSPLPNPNPSPKPQPQPEP